MLAGLIILVLLAWVFFGANLTSPRPDNSGGVARVADPTASGAPKATTEKTTEKTTDKKKDETTQEQTTGDQTASADQTPDENQYADQQSTDKNQDTTDKNQDTTQDTNQGSEEDLAAAPADPTLHLSVPKLGISGALVTGSEAGLESGTELVSGYPWLPGSNTYIAGHRLGFPGTGSDHIFYNLPSMAPGDSIYLTDANGHKYTYQVSEILQVDPSDLGVIGPTGSDMVSLQTCIEDYGDFATLGPDWNVRFIVRANKVA